MTIRNLDHLFAPRSVAVIGASARAGNLGALVLHNLREGGFPGPVWAVNRRPGEVDGVPVVAGVDALPAAPDLAVICTPPSTVPELVAQLGARGTRAAVVLTAGLRSQEAADGRTLEQAMLDAARPHLLRILGPNCIGALVPGAGLNASFGPAPARPGPLAFVTQSGALATAMLDWANERGIGFSHFVSLGDSADVDFGDMLDWLGSDTATRAILLYVESVKNARKFMSAARAAARNKPVIVVKGGRAPAGARAASSHTGALAGSDVVFDAVVRRAGMLRVATLEDLFDAAETLARVRPWRGERLALLTNGGGAGVLAADALALGDGHLATLSEQTLAALDAVLPASWSHGNPVDIIGDAPAERYVQAFRILLAAPEVDGVLSMQAPTAILPSVGIARALLPVLQQAGKPVLSCWLGGSMAAPARQAFAEAGLACYPTPERAVAAWLQLVQHARNQQALLELPAARPPGIAIDRATAECVLAGAQAEGREWLDSAEAAQVLAAYGIPGVATVRVEDPDEAAAVAERIGFPVALKVIATGVVHKSDVGGVVLDLPDAGAVREAAAAMRARVRQAVPGTTVQGFIVQQMARRPKARELIVGISTDPVFGPVVLFGAGGTTVELQKDRSVGLPPLNAVLARDMVARTNVGRLLAGFRGEAPADQEAVVDALLRVSQLACDLAAVAELDINPLLADAQGVLALDVRIRLRRVAPGEPDRLALRPYPDGLEEWLELEGQPLLVRPIRPDDGDRLDAFYRAAPPQDLRLRFFVSRREIPRSELARYCLIDYDREMTFVVLQGDRMVGEVRAVCDPDNVEAEFAVQVAADWQHKGLGRFLLEKLCRYLRERGTRRLVGYCLSCNERMLRLAHEAGFTQAGMVEDACRMVMPLAQD